jgi:O-acetyl-ADP-ribose deacetylase (regulator of RNase III)
LAAKRRKSRKKRRDKGRRSGRPLGTRSLARQNLGCEPPQGWPGKWSCVRVGRRLNAATPKNVRFSRFSAVMRLILVDPNKETCDVLRWQFRAFPEVEVVCGRFEELPHFDCIVTAGNSFGLMDAGIDLAVVKFFGEQVMHSVQRSILDDHLGEQPVGTCLLVSTGNAAHPFVAHAPTMRAPMNIDGTDHVYLALWAAFTAIHRHNRTAERKIEIVACPALGTGTGGVYLLEAALQISLAYLHFKNPPLHINPTLAQQRHETIHYGGRWGFRNPRKTFP